MLDHILACAQAYEREHGVQPNVVYINPLHHQFLLAHYPALFERDPRRMLGLRLVIISGHELSHPQAAFIDGYMACA